MSIHESITRGLAKKEDQFYDALNGKMSLCGLIIGAVAPLIVFFL